MADQKEHSSNWGGARPGAGRKAQSKAAEYFLWEPEVQSQITQQALLYALKYFGFASMEECLNAGIWLDQSLSYPQGGFYRNGVNTVYQRIQCNKLPTANPIPGKEPLYLSIEVRPDDLSCTVREISLEEFKETHNTYQIDFARRAQKEYPQHASVFVPHLL